MLFSSIRLRLKVILPVLLFTFQTSANNFDAIGQTKYNPNTPTISLSFGYDAGSQLTNTTNIRHYLKALEKAHPDKLSLFRYGESWQGRPLHYAVVSSANNMARLQQLKASYKRFADPRLVNKSQLKAELEQLPAVVWLGYGVHGNEVSSPDAALQLLYHLLAAQDDPLVNKILEQVIILVDPIQNPDGREKFIHYFDNNRGPVADGHPLAAERNEGWANGRTNHYLFDMNRDWAAMTQPETQGRVSVLTDWLPMVAVDVHEFGTDYTYYFTPEADPYNPYITEVQKQSLAIIGKNNAKWFDKNDWRYFTREIYDAFFPGYGAGWPVFYGALGMTYEQASPRGLIARNKIGETFTYRDAVERHFVASISTLEAVADNRQLLMQRFWQYRNSAISEGKKGEHRQLVLPRDADAYNTDRLIALLSAQGIEIAQATEPFQSCGVAYQPGDYLIDLAQPNYRMIRNYLDKHVPMEDDFIAIQENLKRLHKNHVLYDVTAWSKTLTHNVPVNGCGKLAKVPGKTYEGASEREPEIRGEGELAWLVDWRDTGSALFLVAALQEGIEVWSSDKAFSQKNNQFKKGTLIIRQNQAIDDLETRLRRLATQFNTPLVKTDSGWVDSGVNFGSQHVVKMTLPKIALAWDRPTRSYAAGDARFVFERELNMPVTAIATRKLAGADLNEFDVLILPDGAGYQRYFNDADIQVLQVWLEQGGVLLAFGRSIDFLSANHLSALEAEANGVDGQAASRTETPQVIKDATQFEQLQVAPDRAMQKFPGVILEAQVNQEHWMTVGVTRPVYTIATGNKTYRPLNRHQGVNIAWFSDAENVLASGYLWQGYHQQLAFKPFVTVENRGEGMVVSFVESPTFRSQQPGLQMLLINALWRSVGHVDATIRNGK